MSFRREFALTAVLFGYVVPIASQPELTKTATLES